MNHAVQYTGLEQWLECPPIHDVTRTVEELVDVELQLGVLKDADWPVLVELASTSMCSPGPLFAKQISLIQPEQADGGVGRRPGVRPTINADVRGNDMA